MAVVLSSWLSEMGFLNWFYVEANAFELSVAEGGSVLCLVERCRGVRAVFLGKVIVAWLSATMELFVQGKESTEFIKSPRDGNKAFLAQRCFNRSVQYLTVVEYRCGEQRGFIVIPEGREGRGWRVCAVELRKVVSFFELSLGERSRTSFPWQPISVLQSNDMGGSSSVSMGKVLESGYWQNVLCGGVRLGGAGSRMPISVGVTLEQGPAELVLRQSRNVWDPRGHGTTGTSSRREGHVRTVRFVHQAQKDIVRGRSAT